MLTGQQQEDGTESHSSPRSFLPSYLLEVVWLIIVSAYDLAIRLCDTSHGTGAVLLSLLNIIHRSNYSHTVRPP